MVSSLSRSTFGHFSRRSLSFWRPRVLFSMLCKHLFLRSFNGFIVFSLLVSFSSAVFCLYLNFFPNLGQHDAVLPLMSSASECNFFNGSWVLDDTYPLYNSSDCPFAERGFNCLVNGRRDRDYQKWRWKPLHCDLPQFDVHSILERLRGKRVVFVGDSMSRTQWESMICLLMTGVEDKKTVYEVHGHKITKQIRFLGVRFSSFNFTVEFFRSVFLVRQGKPPRHAPRRVQTALKLDLMDYMSKKWIDSDFLIFNSGQWWMPGKLFNEGCYFQVNASLKLGMPINTAFRTAMNTWASWVEAAVNTNKTHVFFRTFEPSHWRSTAILMSFTVGSDSLNFLKQSSSVISQYTNSFSLPKDFSRERRSCKVTRYPMTETSGIGNSVFTDVISEVVANMKVPVTLLHVTHMSALRSDGHVGKWSDTPVLDCSHWCLPGVPDTWNELLFSFMWQSSPSPS